MLITNPPALNFSGVSTFNLSTTNSYTYPKNATCCLIIHQLKQYKTKGDNVPRVDLFQNNSPERSGGYNKKLLKYLSSDGSLPLEKFPLQEASKKLFLNREIYFDKSCLNDLIDQLGKTLSAYKINGDNISQLTNNEL